MPHVGLSIDPIDLYHVTGSPCHEGVAGECSRIMSVCISPLERGSLRGNTL